MKKTLSVSPTKKQLRWGAVYLILELSILPVLLAQINYAFGAPLSASKMNIVFFIVNFGITTLIFRGFIKNTLSDAARSFAVIGFAAIRGFLLYWAGNLLVTTLILRLKPDFINVNDASIGAMMQGDFLPLAICTIFFVPVTEELLFRGVLFAGLYNRNRFIAFLFSTIVFSAIHVTGYILDYSWDTLLLCFVQYIPASFALAWAYARSGSILSPILMHIAVNAIGILYMR